MGRRAHKLEDVFKFIDVKGDDECWEWKGHKTPSGYGEFSIKHKIYRAHRIVFTLVNNLPLVRVRKVSADSQYVLHTCDNPPCCNPNHLFLGSPKENTQDMIAKGRRLNNRGLNSCRAKFSAQQVRAIRERYAEGVSRAQLAREFNVVFYTVNAIVNRISYVDVD